MSKAEDKFYHHRYLRAVALQRVDHILERDTAYGASWKASGGRSAWFNVARKIDRLRELMRQPEAPAGFTLEDLLDHVHHDLDPSSELTMTTCVVQYLANCYTAENIFAMIRRDPSGRDGTVLAEVRDLFDYLLLVMAEMTARGVVPAPDPEHIRLGEEVSEVNMGQLSTQLMVDELAVRHGRRPEDLVDYLQEAEKVDVYSELAKSWNTTRQQAKSHLYRVMWSNPPPVARVDTKVANPDGEEPVGKRTVPITDSSRHTSLTPWAVSMMWRHRHSMAPDQPLCSMFTLFYRDVTTGLWVLEPVVNVDEVPEGGVPPILEPHYIEHEGNLILRIEDCPPDARDWFPRLRSELNFKELSEAPPWQQFMYVWLEAETKYRIKPEFQAWVVS